MKSLPFLKGVLALWVVFFLQYATSITYRGLIQSFTGGRSLSNGVPFSIATKLNIRNESSVIPTNSTLPINSTLRDALEIVEAAQAEAKERNMRLMARPRTNVYELRQAELDAPSLIQENGTVSITTEKGTGVNGTVGAAVALVAEAIASNSSIGNITLAKRASSYWMENMVQNGISPLAPSGYKVWRNVRDYGAKGDGITDDTEAINRAISDGNRCGEKCGSTTVYQAVVYFPAGTYLVSRSIVSYYFTQIIGDPTNRPVIKVAPSFVGLGVISSNVYIDGGNGASWYINQSNFYRQVRNLIIDMTGGPLKDYIAGLHWQVAQATSLQNLQIKMSTEPGNNQQGMFMENGSGGVMSDLEFIGGAMGAYVGNQQFTVRNLKFSGQLERAIQIHWDWGWTWKGIFIENCPVGVLMSGPDPTALGSAIFLDSTFVRVSVGFKLAAPSTSTYGRVTLNLFKVILFGVESAVAWDDGKVLLAGGYKVIDAWGLGKRYDTRNGEQAGVWQNGMDYERFPTVDPSLTVGSSAFFYERSKPQYDNLDAGKFFNIKFGPFNAAGNGIQDDTDALNNALRESASSGRILWIPAGIYLVRDTITIPPGAKVVGQSWSQIMGVGSKFSDIKNPYPVVRVGKVGDVGSVEIQDLLFTVKGGTAGAVVLQWNIRESSQGSAAMWDTHIRVGGAAGSELQAGDCPKLSGKINPKCVSASILVHITSKASAYFENTWFWVADHDLDIPAQTQIDIFVGRGVLIESTGPVWLYGTASEHCVLYQYQTLNAGNIFMGMIQTESPYFQATPRAPEPFSVQSGFPSDPEFGFCSPGSKTCAFSWGVRILNSANIYVYGAGLYSWFQEYRQECVGSQNCQDRIFQITESSSVWIYSLITKASIEMISPDGGVAVLGKDNKINYCDIVMAWMGNAGQGNGPSSGGAIYRSPASATVIPFPATTVAPTATFTLIGPVVSQVDFTPNNGNQNIPPGPGASVCERCDLGRLLTSTCCGVGGGISNPIELGQGVSIPRSIILPGGFIPNQQVTGDDGAVYPGGTPLPREVVVPIGTIFPFPFNIPAGYPLSDRWSPIARDNDTSCTMYIASDFWTRDPIISANLPCVIVLPPLITATTWTPPRMTFSTDGQTTTTAPPPYTTQYIRISTTSISKGPRPTQTFKPVPAPSPLCFKVKILGMEIRICPPPLIPFPPILPPITLIPVPPGGRAGPTQPANRPTEEQRQQEEEEEEEKPKSCPYSDGDSYDEDYDDSTFDSGSYPGAGQVYQPSDYIPPRAGTGNPTTSTLTMTQPPPRTTTESTTTVTVIPLPAPTEAPKPPNEEEVPRRPNPREGEYHCEVYGWPIREHLARRAHTEFCRDINNLYFVNMPNNNEHAALSRVYYETEKELVWVYLRIDAKPGCGFRYDEKACLGIYTGIVRNCEQFAGYWENNCAIWTMRDGGVLGGLGPDGPGPQVGGDPR